MGECARRAIVDANMCFNEAIKEYQRSLIVAALVKEHGNICRTARRLGQHRNTLSRWLTVLNLLAEPVKLRLQNRQQPFRFMRTPKPCGIWVDAVPKRKAVIA